jgi:hypothetical protein
LYLACESSKSDLNLLNMCHASSANPSDTGRVKEEEVEEGEEEEVSWGTQVRQERASRTI